MLASADLVGRSADHVGREEIKRPDFIFHAILIEEAPQAALRLILDFWKLIEVWKLEVCSAGEGAGHGRQAVLGLLEDRAFFAVAHVTYCYEARCDFHRRKVSRKSRLCSSQPSSQIRPVSFIFVPEVDDTLYPSRGRSDDGMSSNEVYSALRGNWPF